MVLEWPLGRNEHWITSLVQVVTTLGAQNFSGTATFVFDFQDGGIRAGKQCINSNMRPKVAKKQSGSKTARK